MVPPPINPVFRACTDRPSGSPNAHDGLAARELLVLFLSVRSKRVEYNSLHAGYLLLGLVSSLVFRAARDSLPKDTVAQERIVGALLAALAIADVCALFVRLKK
jgi:hypothetical protein